MSEQEVALELAKFISSGERAKLANEDPREYWLSLYRECLAAVRGKAE